MVEAVVEEAAVKENVFRCADETLPPEAVLASNTSSIPISTLAAATERPDRVIGMHFFNPVPVLQLVEIVRGKQTSDETAETITELARELGKTPAVANDVPGFVSFAAWLPEHRASLVLLTGDDHTDVHVRGRAVVVARLVPVGRRIVRRRRRPGG
jgi:3-hydroxybutyryl-CoA dehydrogenase